MVLRKITIDNSVKYVPITEKDIKQNTIKKRNKVKKFNLFQEEVNKTKIVQKIIKNSLKMLQQVDLLYLQIKKTYSYKYNNKYVNIYI